MVADSHPPSALRRSLDEADLYLIKKGIENTGIKSYNNYLSLLVGNKTRIQVLQSTPDNRINQIKLKTV